MFRTPWRAVIACVVVATALHAPSASAEDCFDRPAVCHFKAGQALLAAKPPDAKRAAAELLASYRLEPKTDTLALYALALGMNEQHALATENWQRVRELAERELADANERVRTAGRRATAADRAAVTRAQNRVDNADNAIGELAGHVARVKIRFRGDRPPDDLVVSREGEGDVDATREVIVKAGRDALLFKRRDGTVVRVVVEIAAGRTETIVEPEPAPAEAAKEDPRATAVTPAQPVGPVATQPATVERGGVRWPVWALFGTGVAAAGVAGVFGYRSVRDWDDAVATGCDETTLVCEPGRAADLASRSNSRARVAQIAGIGAAALVATGVVVWLLGRRSGEPSKITLEVRRDAALIGWRY